MDYALNDRDLRFKKDVSDLKLDPLFWRRVLGKNYFFAGQPCLSQYIGRCQRSARLAHLRRSSGAPDQKVQDDSILASKWM